MPITLAKATPEDYKKIKPLYKTSFPLNERAPFLLLRNRAEQGKAHMLAAKERNSFIGFAYMVCHRDMAYLFYFAVDSQKRGKGYGGKILKELKEYYRGMRIFLAREQLDKNADNYSQRVKRRDFYLQNGFVDLPCRLKEAKVIYDVMGIGGNISKREYEDLISQWCGNLLRKLIDMRILD